MRLRVESKGSSATRGRCATSCSCRSPPFSARTTSAPSVGSPTTVQPPSWVTSRVSLQSRPARSSSASGPGWITWPPLRNRPNGSYPTPSTSTSRSGVQTRCTVSSFSVRVPVLSVQITVVSPSVSTDESRRTSARRRAIRCVARASESVTVGRRPSGTIATMTPMAKTKRSLKPMPSWPATRKNVPPIPIEISATRWVTLFSSRCSGLGSSRVCCVSSAIRPSSVLIPVAVTTASPRPAATNVPAKIVPLGPRRPGLAGERRVVHPQLDVGDNVRVDADAVTRLEHDQITGNEVLGGELDHLAVAPDAHDLRKHLPQRLGRPLRSILLDRREGGVDQDHDGDRHRQLRQAPDQREHRPRPQQEREQVDQVGQEVAQL